MPKAVETHQIWQGLTEIETAITKTFFFIGENISHTHRSVHKYIKIVSIILTISVFIIFIQTFTHILFLISTISLYTYVYIGWFFSQEIWVGDNFWHRSIVFVFSIFLLLLLFWFCCCFHCYFLFCFVSFFFNRI